MKWEERPVKVRLYSATMLTVVTLVLLGMETHDRARVAGRIRHLTADLQTATAIVRSDEPGLVCVMGPNGEFVILLDNPDRYDSYTGRLIVPLPERVRLELER